MLMTAPWVCIMSMCSASSGTTALILKTASSGMEGVAIKYCSFARGIIEAFPRLLCSPGAERPLSLRSMFAGLWGPES